MDGSIDQNKPPTDLRHRSGDNQLRHLSGIQESQVPCVVPYYLALKKFNRVPGQNLTLSPCVRMREVLFKVT